MNMIPYGNLYNITSLGLESIYNNCKNKTSIPNPWDSGIPFVFSAMLLTLDLPGEIWKFATWLYEVKLRGKKEKVDYLVAMKVILHALGRKFGITPWMGLGHQVNSAQ